MRLLKTRSESRYEIYFPRLARVIDNWLQHQERIQRLNNEGEMALHEFGFSQLDALQRVLRECRALRAWQSEMTDVEERNAFPYPSAIMLSQALVRILWTIRERQTYRLTEGAISGASFSPNGLFLATCSFDGTLAIWDLLHGGPPIKVHDGMFWDVAFAPDGTKLATASWDRRATLWDFTGNATQARVFLGAQCASLQRRVQPGWPTAGDGLLRWFCLSLEHGWEEDR